MVGSRSDDDRLPPQEQEKTGLYEAVATCDTSASASRKVAQRASAPLCDSSHQRSRA